MKIKIRNGNSYWSGTPAELVKWATGPCYNEVMRIAAGGSEGVLSRYWVSSVCFGVGFPIYVLRRIPTF
jgi:hypothetical protein